MLMAIKGGEVEVSVIIKGEKPERNPNDANRLTVNKSTAMAVVPTRLIRVLPG